MQFLMIVNDSEIAQFVTKNGVNRLFVDLEYMGKDVRQKGLDTWKSRARWNGLPMLGLLMGIWATLRFSLLAPDPALDERVRRIERRVSGACSPTSTGDVWLDGCA